MNEAPEIVYSAPGAGLGHLVRASAVCLALRALDIPTRIVTNSVYAEGIGRLTGLNIDRISSPHWRRHSARHIASLRPALVVLDSFPFGLRGEWAEPPDDLRFVLLARRLKVSDYIKAAEVPWDPKSPTLHRIVRIEPLAEDHLSQLLESRSDLRALNGRIRFPADDFPTPIPPELEEILERGKAVLVVHTGPETEMARLIDRAGSNPCVRAGGELVLISPVPSELPGLPCFEYFPAAGLYERALKVVTAAGYNCMADLAAWPDKHICLPFQRRYDDQHGRLDGPPTHTDDAVGEAARMLAEWL